MRSDRLLILTSDNPRDEEPADIIRDMEFEDSTSKDAKDSEHCRPQEAIRTAAFIAQPGDGVILIAGKGHEDYQEIKGV